MLKILVVNNDFETCQLHANLLKEYGYQIAAETDIRRVFHLLHTVSFDAVLIDLILPETDSIDLVQHLRQVFPDLPTVIVASFETIDVAVESIKAGAADFVTQPIDGRILDIRLKKSIEHAQTRRLAYTDALTSLDNYRSLHTRLQQEVDRADRYNRPLSLIMLDIDYFKEYNDLHGHPSGNLILAQVATVLKQMSRASDIVARYGGEEFAIILPETNKANAEIFGHRLRQKIEQHKFPGEEILPGRVLTISAGIASHIPLSPKDKLIAAADEELYRAKREGRNRVCVTP